MRDIFRLFRSGRSTATSRAGETAAPGGKRAEAIQRLQVGLSGIAAMVVIVGIANIIQDRARLTEEAAVPDAASTAAPEEAPPPRDPAPRDPLADAGVVPDLPAEPVAPPPPDPLSEAGREDGEDTTTP